MALISGVIWKGALLVVAVAAAGVAAAFEPVPREAAKALGITRGKQFSAGLVFINGKYIDPPYIVERWGTGIRVNSIPVTGQVIDWSEFVKTQDPSKLEKAAAEPASAAPAYTPPPPPKETKSDADALDDLFDDDPVPKKSTTGASAAAYSRSVPQRPKPSAPRYVLSGEFVKNDASKALVKRINDLRTEIDGILRRGGFIFFGDGYSRVAGDARTAESMLGSLPELMQRSQNVDALRSGIRSAHMVYLNEILSAQLFSNRVDYRRLKDRRQQLKKDREWSNLLNEVNRPLL